MVEFINNSETKSIDQIVTRYFVKHSWKIQNTLRGAQPTIQLSKNNAVFLVRSIDADTQNFLSLSKILDRMEKFAHDIRSSSGGAVAYVLRKPLLGFKETTAPDRGIALFMATDLAALERIESLDVESPTFLDNRSKLIIQGCEKLCLALADSAIKQGSWERALEWLELNLVGVHRLTEAHYKLVDLLIKKKDFDAAKGAIQIGLNISAHNVALLTVLRDLELKTGNHDAIAAIEQRIATASVARPTFELILASQRASQTQMHRTSMVQGQENGVWRRLLSRLQHRTP